MRAEKKKGNDRSKMTKSLDATKCLVFCGAELSRLVKRNDRKVVCLRCKVNIGLNTDCVSENMTNSKRDE